MKNKIKYLAVSRSIDYRYDVDTDEYSSFDKYGILISNAGYSISHKCKDNYEVILNLCSQAIDDYDYDIKQKNHYEFSNLTEIIEHHFRLIVDHYEGKINKQIIHKIKEIFDWHLEHTYNNCDAETVSEILSALTGRDFVVYTMTGCCQGDWIEYIIDESVFSAKSIDYIEAEWMGTGTAYDICEITSEETEEIEDAIFDDEFDERDYQARMTDYIYIPYKYDLAEEFGCESDEILVVNCESYQVSVKRYTVA